MISVFDIITGGVSESQKGVLSEVLPKVYASKGIYQDDLTTWLNEPPVFSDMYRELRDMLQSYSKRGGKSSQDVRRSIEVLLNRVGMYTKNGFFGFLDRPTKIKLEKRFLNFDLSNLPPAVKPLVMFSVMDVISKEIRKDREPKILLIDEGWALLRSKEAENYLLEFIKSSRKYGTSVGFITQEIEDLLGSESGRSILNMTSTKILMRQNSSNIELISRNMRLNDNEKDFLLRCRKGHGLLITEHGHFKFFTKASDRIHELITTDPREVAGQERKERLLKMQEKKDEMKSVLEDKAREFQEIQAARGKSEIFEPKDTLYSVKDLSTKQIEELERLGFERIHTTKHGKGGDTDYLVKPRGNETALHHFICKVVEEDLRKHTEKIELKETMEPDVLAEINGKVIAFEVETGSRLRQDEEILRGKFDRVRENYPVYYIVVTDRLIKNKYKKFGEVITRGEIKTIIERLVAQTENK